MMKLWFALEYYDLVKFEVLDKVSGVNMVPKGTVNLGSCVVRFMCLLRVYQLCQCLGEF